MSLLKQMFFIGLALAANCSVAQEKDFFVSNNEKINKKEFDEKIDSILAITNIPAVSLAIIEDNKIAYSNSFGYKHQLKKEVIDNNTLFEACSLSKIYLVAAAYKLVDQGLLDLDKPIFEYKTNEKLAYDARYKLITPRMILSHTSGIENWEWLNVGGKLEILQDPGTQYTYSGEGFHYLARVIQTILDKPYEEYLDEIVLSPLNLKQIDLNYTPADSIGNYANGHSIIGKSLNKWVTKDPWPASSIHTTAESFAKLLVSVFDEQFLTKESIAKMTKPVMVIEEGNDSKYGIANGFFVLENENDKIVNFSGDNKGFKADMLYSPIHKRGFVFFTNSDLGGVFGKHLNKLTTNLDANLYLDKPYFKDYETISDLIVLYNQEGKGKMFERIDSMKEEELNFYLLEELMFDFYSKDKEASERIAETILKYDKKSAASYFLIGVVNLKVHNNPVKAKEYLYKCKNLGFNRFDVDSYIRSCDDSIAQGH
ncbi:CubicO group peptidase, beta-lactamase class C family [Aquimarina spongiae]|uniref:CubicO group peptidase, beta-lactamase class C family n=2 Tax=Aquimarina spongiae TaxID=570521 RepID=A0A1M6H0Q6_9FLAO|nr:CubicO group peptidase, beta-lactamase class C family [Aquimarina spongiae]